MSSTLSTSFRMYGALPRVARAWRTLFDRVFRDCGADVRMIEHRAPAPIEALWASPGLCCDFMCGWPFVRTQPAMQAIAAPVPSPPRYEGQPRYCSEFLVREASGWTALEHTFGHRFGWTVRTSQSGFNAPRAALARFADAGRRALYREASGPLGSPLQALEALHAAKVDVIALDGYFLDLCRRHEPERLVGVRCIAVTPWTPIPLLVAAPGVDRAIVERLSRTLASLAGDATFAPLLDDVLVQRFVVPDVAAYGMLESMAREAAERGYTEIR